MRALTLIRVEVSRFTDGIKLGVAAEMPFLGMLRDCPQLRLTLFVFSPQFNIKVLAGWCHGQALLLVSHHQTSASGGTSIPVFPIIRIKPG